MRRRPSSGRRSGSSCPAPSATGALPELFRAGSQRGRIDKREYNQLSVRLELQADFYAGVWAHHAEKKWQILERGDVEEAIRAANAIGDDRLQKQSSGRVVPDAFTHGTSEQRMRWFKRGLQSGRMEDGDTFSIRYDSL